jgi:glycosyltransferase involved in cell wall biosynthesis
MKVVMIGPYPEPGARIKGGVERVIDTLLPELAKAVDLTLVVPSSDYDGYQPSHGVPTLYVRRAPCPGALRYWNVDAQRVSRVVGFMNPDIVHVQGAAAIGSFLTMPRLLTVHGIVEADVIASKGDRVWSSLLRQSASKLVSTVERRARRSYDGIIVINPYVREAYPDIAGNKQFDIPNPLNPSFLEIPAGTRSSGERRLISVGQIGARKNTFACLQAVLELLKDGLQVSLTLCGAPIDGHYHRDCRELIENTSLKNKVAILGNVSARELIEQLDRADCMILASKQETAPVSIAEANSRGVPVVAPRAFGIRHMIEHRRNGLFLNPENPASWPGIIRTALEIDWDRAAIAEHARQIYDVKRIAELTIAAYHQVI